MHVSTYRLESLLDLRVQSTTLQCNDLGGRIGIMGNGRATLRAEDAVDSLAGGTLASPALGGAVDGQLGLGDDGNQSWLRVSNCGITTQTEMERDVYSRLSHSGVGSRRSGRSQ